MSGPGLDTINPTRDAIWLGAAAAQASRSCWRRGTLVLILVQNCQHVLVPVNDRNTPHCSKLAAKQALLLAAGTVTLVPHVPSQLLIQTGGVGPAPRTLVVCALRIDASAEASAAIIASQDDHRSSYMMTGI
jgi:hypothetical protein